MTGTVKAHTNFESAVVAETLRKAMVGYGTKDDVIVNVLGNHTSDQRIEIAEAYKKAYGKALVDEIKAELHGDFEDICVALLTPSRDMDAVALYKAMHRLGTDESTLVDIVCTKTNEEIQELKQTYKRLYDLDLEEDLKSDTSGYFRRLLVSLMTAAREPETKDVDDLKALDDSNKFYTAGKEDWAMGADDMNEIMCLRSRKQLMKTFEEFEKYFGKPIERLIVDSCSGSVEDGFLAIVGSTKDLPAFYARRLRQSTKGFFIKDSALIRIIVGRSEIDLFEIAEAFSAIYGANLKDVIDKECSGNYKKLLIALITPPEEETVEESDAQKASKEVNPEGDTIKEEQAYTLLI